MAQSHLHQSVLAINPNARVAARIKTLVTGMRPKFDTMRSVTIGAIPVESQTVHDLYGDYLELAALVRTHPLFGE
jgi:hypothetical protein